MKSYCIGSTPTPRAQSGSHLVDLCSFEHLENLEGCLGFSSRPPTPTLIVERESLVVQRPPFAALILDLAAESQLFVEGCER